MTKEVKKSKNTPIRFNPQEQAVAEWLAKKTKRPLAGAVKWATSEMAESLGYVAEEKQKKK